MMKEKLEMNKWGESLNRFSEINRNRPTRLEVIGQIGNLERDYWMEDGLPLMGIDVDMKGENSPRVQIMLASRKDADASHLTHVVSKAKTVVVELGYEGQFDGLQIEDTNGAKTILRFETKEPTAAIAA
jgi:hypothetical protein